MVYGRNPGLKRLTFEIRYTLIYLDFWMFCFLF